jgi:integrase
LYPRFEKRSKGPDGWRLKTIDTAPKSARPKIIKKQNPRRPTPGPTQKTRERMATALRMKIIQGKTIAEIADELGFTSEVFHYWRRNYGALYDEIETKLTNEVIGWVRQAVGTDAILESTDLYMARALTAEKWCQAAEVPLFPTTEETTLCSFYETYYLPTCLYGASESTLGLYRGVLKRWKLLTGDPPLRSIDVALLAKFRDALSKMRGMEKWQRAAPSSVATTLRHVQTLLDKAGPPGRRNRDAAGLIETVPWVRQPRSEPREVHLVDPAEIDAVYLAAVGMERPRIEGLQPAKWWRALLVTVWNTGLRRRSLLELSWDMVDWKLRLFRIPGRSMKAKRFQIQPFPEMVASHLHAIRRSEHGLIFPWSGHIRDFHTKWCQLLDLAGIPAERHFGLHDIRKTLATTLWGSDPQAAQFVMGHSSSTVTARHYVAQTGIVARAVDAIPQPASFGAVTPEELVNV